MEIIIGLAVGLVIAVVAVLVVQRRQPVPQAAAPLAGAQPTLTAAEIRDVIREIHGETLRDIAEALGIELTKTVEWTATIEVSGTIELDILQEYDVESELYDNLYVDSQNGQIEIVDTEVTSAREC